MQIILAAVEPPLVDAWQRFCDDIDGVTIHRGSILDLACDAVVSPANSFGFMDGGIDLLYSRFFGWQVQDQLQQLIRDHHHGELLVGTAEIVPTKHLRIPFVIAAPTMRVPMILRDTINPYLACRAVLLLVRLGTFRSGPYQGEPISAHINTVAIPGLGTGVGRVGPNTCARQVRAAIEDTLLERRSFPTSWHDAQRRHQQLYGDTIRDLQYE
jgi:O-acetyl-ADP-ribose deacetylase (regulator of RNase III)